MKKKGKKKKKKIKKNKTGSKKISLRRKKSKVSIEKVKDKNLIKIHGVPEFLLWTFPNFTCIYTLIFKFLLTVFEKFLFTQITFLGK